MVWYASLLKNFPQFVVIHTVKVFIIVNEAEVNVFLELSCFSMIQQMSVWSLPFLNPAWSSGSSWFMYCWSLAWRILSITLLACKCNCVVVWTFFGIPFLYDWDENWLFQSCGHCWVFQIFWHLEYSTFTVSSFRIWNSSTRIPWPSLALFVVMLPKAQLTSHPRISGPRWVITPSWLPGSLRSSLHSSFVYFCHLLLTFSASETKVMKC